MTRQLTPQEGVVLQMDTNYLDAGIPVYGSRVLTWTQNNNMVVMIYRTKDYGYVLSDITSLGSAVINELARQSEVHDMWYYLPQSIQEVIAERAEQTVQVAESVGKGTAEILEATAQTVGTTVGELIGPLVNSLMVPLVIVGAIAAIYLIKKG